MSYLGRAVRAVTFSNPSEWLITALGGTTTYSGKTVTPATALEIAPWWRGVNILSNAFRTAPFKVYQGREEARASNAWRLLHDSPNPTMAADEFWGIAESHVETWGNAFAYKQYDAHGLVDEVWNIDPARVAVHRDPDGTLLYVIDDKVADPFTSANILHIRGLSSDGVVGYSTVQLAKQSLGAELARTEFAGRFWENDATPGVTLIHPNKLSTDATERLRELWDKRHKGPSKKRATAVLGEGVDVKQMTMPLEDAQFIEQGRFSRTDIALWLGLPPYMLAGESGGDSLTYSTTEGHSLDLLKWTIGPRFVGAQNTVNMDGDLMPFANARLTERLHGEFVSDAILRATTKERYEAYSLAPHLTVDEVREIEGKAPLGDERGKQLVAEFKSAAKAKDTNQ